MISLVQPSEIERGLSKVKETYGFLVPFVRDITALSDILQQKVICGTALMLCEAYIWADEAAALPKANDFDDLRERTAALHTLILDDYKKIRG